MCREQRRSRVEDYDFEAAMANAPLFYAYAGLQLELNEINMITEDEDCTCALRCKLFGRIVEIKEEFAARKLHGENQI